jgi:hypothetical protein
MSIGETVGAVSEYAESAEVPADQVLGDPLAVRRAVLQALGRVAVTIGEEVEALQSTSPEGAPS